jgi:hypothetical protein
MLSASLPTATSWPGSVTIPPSRSPTPPSEFVNVAVDVRAVDGIMEENQL